jgi:hypothetical protein
VIGCPATVIDPVRAAVAALAATSNVTVCAPLLSLEEVTVTQSTCDSAVHMHPASVVTVTDSFPPTNPTVTDWGLTSKVQGAAS